MALVIGTATSLHCLKPNNTWVFIKPCKTKWKHITACIAAAGINRIRNYAGTNSIGLMTDSSYFGCLLILASFIILQEQTLRMQ
jgi:hypothetical protein